MKKMYEDLLRNRGIYVAPNSSFAPGSSQLPNSLINSSASINKRVQGYKIPRKFTLESLGKMDYTDFLQPNNSDYNDEFKPSDVLDSDDEMDDDIMKLYQFKNKPLLIDQTYHSVPVHVNSSVDLHHPHISVSTNIMPLGPSKKVPQTTSKNQVMASAPISRLVKRNEETHHKVNKSTVPQRRKSVIRTEHRYADGKKNHSPPKQRKMSVNHGLRYPSKSPKKNNSHVYGSKPNLRVAKAVNSDYSPGRRRKTRLEVGNLKSLKRANEHDSRVKRKQDQRLKNILKMQNEKVLNVHRKKLHL